MRRMKLPGYMYGDDACVKWDVTELAANQTHAEFKYSATIDDGAIHGPEAILKVESDSETGSCSFSMQLNVSKDKKIPVKDWRISFDSTKKIMAGYVCIPNTDHEQIKIGFHFKNLLFIYVKSQWSGMHEEITENLQEMAGRFAEELKNNDLYTSRCQFF